MKLFCTFASASAKVYLVKKSGGSDDGTLYAMKILNITNAFKLESYSQAYNINSERKVIKMSNNVCAKDQNVIIFTCLLCPQMLKAVRELPWVSRLYYAFHKGRWLFLVMGKIILILILFIGEQYEFVIFLICRCWNRW